MQLVHLIRMKDEVKKALQSTGHVAEESLDAVAAAAAVAAFAVAEGAANQG